MKLKNTSDKIIHVNTNILLPGQEISIAKSATETPGMRALVNFNLISLTEEPDDKKAKAVKEEPKEEVEEVAEEPKEEERPKATRGRKASK